MRRSRQSAAQGKGVSKGEHHGGGPAVKDPEDGKIRTPKGLLTAGPLQVPAKHVAGLMSTINDEGLMSRMTAASDVSEGHLASFPSFGNFSLLGSRSTPTASEAGEEPTGPVGAGPAVRTDLAWSGTYSLDWPHHLLTGEHSTLARYVAL